MTEYRIRIATRAKKNLQKLQPAIQQRIIRAIRLLKSERHPQQSKYLKGKAVSQFRLRVGDYRVLYDIYDDDRIVLIHRVGHRRDIYR